MPVCPMGKLYGCHQFLNWWPGLSTGQSHLDGFESLGIREVCGCDHCCGPVVWITADSPTDCLRRSIGFSHGLKTVHRTVFTLAAQGPPFRIPRPNANKKERRSGVLFYWQRMRDSNPRKRSQSPVCYRYTNPLWKPLLLYAIFQKCQASFFRFLHFLFLWYEKPFVKKFSLGIIPKNFFQ